MWTTLLSILINFISENGTQNNSRCQKPPDYWCLWRWYWPFYPVYLGVILFMTFTSAPVTGTGPSSNDAKEILISMKTTEKWRKVASQWCYFQLSFTFYFEQCKNLCYKKRNWSQEELVMGSFGAFRLTNLNEYHKECRCAQATR